MIKYRKGELRLLLPQKYSEISIGKYEKLKDLALEYDPELKDNYKVQELSILSGLDEEIIDKVEGYEIDHLQLKLDWMRLENPLAEKSKFQQLYNIQGKKYYFQTNLKDIMSWLEFVESNKILASQNEWSAMPSLMAVILRPVEKIKFNYSKWKGWKKEDYINYVEVQPYKEKDLESRANLFREHLTVEDCRYIGFFLSGILSGFLIATLQRSSSEHLTPIQRYRLLKLKEILGKIVNLSSLKDGAGMTSQNI